MKITTLNDERVDKLYKAARDKGFDLEKAIEGIDEDAIFGMDGPETYGYKADVDASIEKYQLKLINALLDANAMEFETDDEWLKRYGDIDCDSFSEYCGDEEYVMTYINSEMAQRMYDTAEAHQFELKKKVDAISETSKRSNLKAAIWNLSSSEYPNSEESWSSVYRLACEQVLKEQPPKSNYKDALKTVRKEYMQAYSVFESTKQFIDEPDKVWLFDQAQGELEEVETRLSALISVMNDE